MDTVKANLDMKVQCNYQNKCPSLLSRHAIAFPCAFQTKQKCMQSLTYTES